MSERAHGPPTTSRKGLLRGLPVDNIIQPVPTQVSIELDDNGEAAVKQPLHMTRACQSGRPAATYNQYDMKYHPMDEQTRPKRAAKRRSGSRSMSVLTNKYARDSDSEDDLDSVSAQGTDAEEEVPGADEPDGLEMLARSPDPRASRQSKRISKQKPLNYSTKHHPQDWALPNRSRTSRATQRVRTQSKRKRRSEAPEVDAEKLSSYGPLFKPQKKLRRLDVSRTSKPRSVGTKRSKHASSTDDPEDLAEEALRNIGVMLTSDGIEALGATEGAPLLLSSGNAISSDVSTDPNYGLEKATETPDKNALEQDFDDILLGAYGRQSCSTSNNDATSELTHLLTQDEFQVMQDDLAILEQFHVTTDSKQPLSSTNGLTSPQIDNDFSDSSKGRVMEKLEVATDESRAPSATDGGGGVRNDQHREQVQHRSDSPFEIVTPPTPGHTSSKTIVADSESDGYATSEFDEQMAITERPSQVSRHNTSDADSASEKARSDMPENHNTGLPTPLDLNSAGTSAPSTHTVVPAVVISQATSTTSARDHEGDFSSSISNLDGALEQRVRSGFRAINGTDDTPINDEHRVPDSFARTRAKTTPDTLLLLHMSGAR